MFDLHTHILPGLDDGAADLAEALAMLRIASADGIATIVGTPHHDGEGAAYRGLVLGRLGELRGAAARERLPITILSGYEVALAPDLPERLGTGRDLGINGGRYLLVEASLRLWPPFVFDVLFRLQGLGYRPILAHVERYGAILADERLATRLVQGGVVLQVNGSSLLGLGGRRAARCAERLLSGGLVGLLASDAHSPRQRAPRLRAAAARAARLIGPAAAEALVIGNPAAIVADADLSAMPPLRRPRRLFGLFPGPGFLHRA